MRNISVVGAVPVVSVAGYASYFHIAELTIRHGQSQSVGHLMPIAIDGLMIVAAVAVIAQRNAWFPKIAFCVGALLTLGANILSVREPNLISYVIAAAPAVALLFSAELLLRQCLPVAVKKKRRKTATRVRPVPVLAT